jgi:pimeloyl-ACP methyl ester carboxylesterase
MKRSQSTKIQAEMDAIYEEKLSRWPVPYESVYIQTQYGHTHVLISGNPGNRALVLLPGLAVTSMMWLPNIETLSKHFHCFALDLIGDHGKSRLIDAKVYPRSGREYSIWLRMFRLGWGYQKPFWSEHPTVVTQRSIMPSMPPSRF